MATYYVWSGATGAADGTSKTDAYTTVQAGLTAATTLGDLVYVHKTHFENPSADMNLAVNSAHTREQPLQLVVVDMDSSDTPVSDYQASGNAELDVSAGGYHVVFTTGSVYVWGMRFKMTDSVSGTHFVNSQTFEQCRYEINTTNGELVQAGSRSKLVFIESDITWTGTGNVRFYLASSSDGQSIEVYGGSFSTAAAASSFYEIGGDSNGKFYASGVDLTGMNTSGNVINIAGTSESCDVAVTNCKLPATEPTIIAGTLKNLPANSAVDVVFEEAFRRYSARFNGIAVEETTIRRASGASDGSTDFSLNVSSTSDARESSPYRVLLACQNYGNLSGKTLKVHFAQDSGAPTAIKDNDIWIEVHAATSTASDFTKTNPIPLAAGTNHTDESGSEDWRDGAGALSGYTEQSISASGFGTTQGMLYVWLCVAADYTTTNSLYVCPKIEIA
jgi:hypothetical protein